MFSGRCIFIEHSGGYMIINHQVAINATENVEAKLTFDREAQSKGVVIKGYRTDNGFFNGSSINSEALKNPPSVWYPLIATT